MTTHIPQNGIAARLHAMNNPPAANELSSKEKTTSIFGEDGFTFGDIIDIINPLQHIPIVSSIYRKVTGDVIAPAMEIAGGALFGGPLGAAMSVVSTAFKSHFQNNDVKSVDPESPYGDGEINNRTAIASNTLTGETISAKDYIVSEEADIKQTIKQTNNNTASVNVIHNGILSSANMIQTHNNNISLNTLSSRRVYQPSDGIINMAYRNTEHYSDVITSTNTTEKKVDIIIGSTAGAG